MTKANDVHGLYEMSDDELEQLLKRDRAVTVTDDGFCDRTLASLPSGARQSKRQMLLIIMTLLGLAFSLLLPSGAQALIYAFQDIMGARLNTQSFLIVFMPLLLLFALSTSLLLDEQ
jgi:hypothetical protein